MDSAANEPASAPQQLGEEGKRKPKKKRVRNFTPDDRAAHRVFEKSRREAFNRRLFVLANSIPSLNGVRRLSKHIIVDESIAHHKLQRSKCAAASREIRGLLAERDELLAEVNVLRSLHKSVGAAPNNTRKARPVDPSVLDMLKEEENQGQESSTSSGRDGESQPDVRRDIDGFQYDETTLVQADYDTLPTILPQEPAVSTAVADFNFPVPAQFNATSAVVPTHGHIQNPAELPGTGPGTTADKLSDGSVLDVPPIPLGPTHNQAPWLAASQSNNTICTEAVQQQINTPPYIFSPKDLEPFTLNIDDTATRFEEPHSIPQNILHGQTIWHSHSYQQ